MSSTNRGAKRRPADFYPTPPGHVRALIRWILDEDIRTRCGFPLIHRTEPWRTTVIDPSAGDGAILREFKAAGVDDLRAYESREECLAQLVELCGAGNVVIGNSLSGDIKVRQGGDVDLYVQNPPFSLAREFIEHWAVGRVAAVLVASSYFRGHTDGKPAWWQGKEPVRMLQLPVRPSFVDVCKGFAKTKTRARVKGCGESYPSGTGGKCTECGGNVARGSDSADYCWLLFQVEPSARPIRVAPVEWFA